MPRPEHSQNGYSEMMCVRYAPLVVSTCYDDRLSSCLGHLGRRNLHQYPTSTRSVSTMSGLDLHDRWGGRVALIVIWKRFEEIGLCQGSDRCRRRSSLTRTRILDGSARCGCPWWTELLLKVSRYEKRRAADVICNS